MTNHDDGTMSPELTNDLKDLEITKLSVELDKQKKRTQELDDRYNEVRSENRRLYRGHRKAWGITLAIVVPLLIAVLTAGYYAYHHLGGGPEGRAATEAAEAAAVRARSWEAHCERAGGRVIGDVEEDRFCVFSNGASLHKFGRSS